MFPSLLLQIHHTYVAKYNQNLKYKFQAELPKSLFNKLGSLTQASSMVNDNVYGQPIYQGP